MQKEETDRDKDIMARPHGGQHPTEICTFPRGKRCYLFPGLPKEEKTKEKKTSSGNKALAAITETDK